MDREQLKQQAITNPMRRPMADRTQVVVAVEDMDDAELEWTANATDEQLLEAARRSYPIARVEDRPQSWWYH